MLIDATAACDATFSVQTVDDLVTAPEESLRALPARIRAVVFEAICQGAATVLVTAQP